MPEVVNPGRDRQRHSPVYSPSYEHDSCGVGLDVDIEGRPSLLIVEKALAGLVNLTHRGGVGADARRGDGAGLLIQIPHKFFASVLAEVGVTVPSIGHYGVAVPSQYLPDRDRDPAGGFACQVLGHSGDGDRIFRSTDPGHS